MKPLSKVPMVPMGMPLSDLQLWGGKLTKGSSCVPKSIIASMLRLCLGAQWTVPSQCLSASEITKASPFLETLNASDVYLWPEDSPLTLPHFP